MSAYYNEIDPKAATWLRELISAGLIADGEVDERSITEVAAEDVRGFRQCHFFAGIGGWSLALRLAGVPDDAPVWTDSCPCQPLSCAGQRKGHEDERHLWPEFERLIRECSPPVVFGEQVASHLGREWLAGVQLDLEALGFAVGAADLCAAGVGAPHIRQRVFWVAIAEGAGWRPGAQLPRPAGRPALDGAGEFGGVGNAMPVRSQEGCCRRNETSPTRGTIAARGLADAEGQRDTGEHRVLGAEPIARRDEGNGTDDYCTSSRLALPECPERRPNSEEHEHDGCHAGRDEAASRTGARREGFWSASRWHACRDGKQRRVPLEPALFPLAPGLPGRVGLLRGAGNAIVPEIAAVFVESALGAIEASL